MNKEAISTVKKALAHLRATTEGHPELYELLSKPYIEMIEKLEGDN